MPRPPTITEHPSDVTAISGSDVSFTCSASGQPLPTFTWYHGGEELTPGGEVTVTSSGGRSTLSVGAVGEEEEGEYHCQAANSLGSASSESAQLQLACELLFVWKTITRRGENRRENTVINKSTRKYHYSRKFGVENKLHTQTLSLKPSTQHWLLYRFFFTNVIKFSPS